MKPTVQTIAAAPERLPETSSTGTSARTSLALTGLCMSILMPSMATSIANASLPELARAFGATFQAAQWILLSYLLALTTVIVVAGRLGDLIGRRRLLMAGIAVFTFASLLCGLASTLPLLIAARGLQGLGAAMMMALTMAFVSDIVSKSSMGRTMGLLGTMSAVGTTLGPSMGGLLLAYAGWPAIFLINVPIGIAALVLARITLPVDERLSRTTLRAFDFPGIALLMLALGGYAGAMTIGRGQMGWLNVSLLLAALGAGTCFLVVEAKASVPLIQLALFRHHNLRTGLLTSGLISTVMMTTLVVGPFYLSRALGLSAAMLGLTLSAGPLVATITGVPAGRLVDHFGADRIGTGGLVAILAGALGLSIVPAVLGVAGYLATVLLMTGGYAMFQTANNSDVMATAPPAQRGLVSAMLNLARNLGLVTGASAMGAMFALGVGEEVGTASPAAITIGMHVAFAISSMLIALALGLVIVKAIGRHRRPLHRLNQ